MSKISHDIIKFMKKKLALIVISLDECFPKEGFSGGGHKVTKHLILELISSNKFDIDIYCKKGLASEKVLDGINSIKVLDKKRFKAEIEDKLAQNKYDYILSSDVLLPFANNLIHSNSSKYKSKNGKNKLIQFILQFYNAKKIKNQEINLCRNKAVFTVSESLKKDYVDNFNLNEKNVFVCYPAVDNVEECEISFNDKFTIGAMAGGGLNKGGYLLLFALKKLQNKINIKARIIFPKIKKAFFYKYMIKLLGLQEIIEILPKQKDMNEYYKSVDCYVLPSLNESFGLVVTEAASNCRPSLASSTTGVSELIKDGENGFIFGRTHSPVRNLSQRLCEISTIYYNNKEEFIRISKNSKKICTQLEWKKFSEIIIDNMVKES